jgi:muramoyltetrapeptide carboxypeptidase
MNSIRPPYLNPGDNIMLVAPARFASRDIIQDASAAVIAAGFTPVIPSGLEERDNQFGGSSQHSGGSDCHRAELLNSAFRDPSIRAVFALRGGYGSGRLLPLLDSTAFLADPKWIIGFSDITTIHSWATNLGIASLHAPVASTLKFTLSSDVDALWASLRGDFAFTPEVKITGGNLSVLYSLLGTPYFPDVSDSRLFLEDLDEYLYHIDRMFLALKLAGVFEKADGLIIGTFDDLRDNTIADGQSIDNPFGLTIKEIISEHVPYGYPIKYDNTMGHGERNYPLVLGG